MPSVRRQSLRLRGVSATADLMESQASPPDHVDAAAPSLAKKRLKSTLQCDAENIEPSGNNQKSQQSSPKAKKAKKGPVQLSKSYEERLWQKGNKFVAGVDEAGRGPLAGPVVAAACIVTEDVDIPAIADSKTITEKNRESIYEELIAHPGVTWAIGIQDAQDIDKINILQATYRAMETAVAGLPEAFRPTAVLVDGNRTPPNIEAAYVEAIIKGDGKVFSIAAASIIAKVTRDRMMHEAHAKWPEYGFAQHKGYGTKLHMATVRRLGPCPIHRLTFRPLPEIVSEQAEAAGKPETAEAEAQRKESVEKHVK